MNTNYVVLGANGGIGSETCRQLRAGGSQVMLLGRNEQALSRLSREIDTPYQVCEATSIDEVEQRVCEASEKMGGIHGIVNCVGSVLLKPAHLTSPVDWQETLQTNLTSAFAVVRAGVKAMRKNGGSIVLFTSAAARIGLANHDAIAAAKAGVIGLMQASAASYASRGIRVNAIAPGLVRTGLTERIWSNEKSAETSRRMHPLGRLGTPADVASMASWLLRPENDWITGQVIGVDGGLGTLRSNP